MGEFRFGASTHRGIRIPVFLPSFFILLLSLRRAEMTNRIRLESQAGIFGLMNQRRESQPQYAL